MAMRGAIAYSAFRRSKTHLVYTTEDLRVRFVDRTHFFGRAHPEKRAYALPIGKVGLGEQNGAPCMESNLRPAAYKAAALPTELTEHGAGSISRPGLPLTRGRPAD